MAAPDALPLRGWSAWWFAPLDPRAWRWLSAATGALIAWQLLSYGGRHADFFGAGGWLDAAALRASVAVVRGAGDEAPELNAGLPDPAGEGLRIAAPRWSPMYWADRSWKVHALFAATLLAAGCLMAGAWPRLAAPVAWLGACSFATQPITAAGGGESLVLIAAFGTMLGNVLADRRGGGSGPRLALRLWQLHFAALLVATGLAKAQSGDWWQGTALWLGAHPGGTWTADAIQKVRNEPAALHDELARWALAARALIVWQVWFPVFAWRGRGRWLAVAGGALGLLWTLAISGDPLFGPAVCVCCLAFLRSEDLRRWQRKPRS